MVVFAVGVAVVDTLLLAVVTSFLGFMSVWSVYALGVWGGLYAAAWLGGATTAGTAAVGGGGDAGAPPASPGGAAAAEGAAAATSHLWQVMAQVCLAAAAGAGVAGVLRTLGGVASGGVRVAAGAVAGGAAAAAGQWRTALLGHAQTVTPYWDPADWGSLVRPGGVLAAALAALAVPAAVRLGAEGAVAAAAAGASRLAAARAAGATAESPAIADWQRAARARSLRLVVVAVVETVVASGEVFGWWGRRRLGLVSAIFLLGAVGLGDAGTGIAWVFS
ncbi:hypothetical protein I4F81_005059 [Pyropia yezoensis]|uniref:Uncharacterized protein n=1 Tax=Pyropia yezoensis TaxID=2788 RepID=A0ACC3BYC2_PYRYE|nr:hypothetical protein I4F81_005059 [Neopyropia yezoensis]